MKRCIVFMTILVGWLNSVHAQVIPEYHFSFSQCDLQEEGGNLGAMELVGTMPGCICGPENEAPELDGNQYLMMEAPGDLLQRDFTLSFDILPKFSADRQILFTNERICGMRDSLFKISYTAVNETITLEISEIGGIRGLIQAGLDADRCWQNVAIVREGRFIFMYVNGLLKSQFEGNQSIEVYSNDSIRIGGTPCMPNTGSVSFLGAIDEIKWFSQALSPLQIQAANLGIDEIETGDTLIFLGDSFLPRTTTSCAQNISWSPTLGLSDPLVIDPVVGPTQTTTYTITFDYGFCLARDSMKVTVVDPTDISCGDILLPSAFTPNGDLVNDLYGISNFFIVEELESFQIMDRWGNTLFEAADRTHQWDGTYKGRVMSSGAYIYRVEYRCGGEEYAKVGSFNLIR